MLFFYICIPVKLQAGRPTWLYVSLLPSHRPTVATIYMGAMPKNQPPCPDASVWGLLSQFSLFSRGHKVLLDLPTLGRPSHGTPFKGSVKERKIIAVI